MELRAGYLLSPTQSLRHVVREWGDGFTWNALFLETGMFDDDALYFIRDLAGFADGNVEITAMHTGDDNWITFDVPVDVARDMRQSYLDKGVE